jgi:hypothetical protein
MTVERLSDLQIALKVGVISYLGILTPFRHIFHLYFSGIDYFSYEHHRRDMFRLNARLVRQN